MLTCDLQLFSASSCQRPIKGMHNDSLGNIFIPFTLCRGKAVHQQCYYRTMSSDCLLQSKLWVLDHVLNDEWACQQRMRVWAVEVETSKLEMSLNNCLIAFFSFDGCLARCYYSNCILTTRWEKCAFNRPSTTSFTRWCRSLLVPVFSTQKVWNQDVNPYLDQFQWSGLMSSDMCVDCFALY